MVLQSPPMALIRGGAPSPRFTKSRFLLPLAEARLCRDLRAVRDTVALAQLDPGIKALGSNRCESGKNSVGEIDVPVEFGTITAAWCDSTNTQDVDDDGRTR
jgi:hypothetical protein